MRHHINRLRAKPDHEKNKISLIVSISFTLVVLFFWSMSFTLHPIGTEPKIADKSSSPVSIIKGGFANALSAISSKEQKTTNNGKGGLEVVGNKQKSEEINYLENINY